MAISTRLLDMRFLRLLAVCALLSAAGCAKSTKEHIKMDSGRGCSATWEWCFNCTLDCLEVEEGEGSKEVNEDRGEPGIGVEIMKMK